MVQNRGTLTTLAVVNNYFRPGTFRGSGLLAPDMWNRTGPVQLNQMEVRTESERHPMLRISRTGSLASKEPRRHFKVHEVRLDVDAESGQEK